MELKKNPKYDSKSYGLNFFLTGLLVAELLALSAFKYTQYEKSDDTAIEYDIVEDVEELADITVQNEPPPPKPPPPPPATVTVVEDDVEVDTTQQVVVNEDPTDYIPTVAPAPPPREPEKTGEAEVFEVVEKMPTYPGGEEARQRFIAKHLVYPPLDIENQKQGTVYVEFIVEPNGSLSNVRHIKTFSDDAGNEAVRVVKMMKWTPGEQRGKAVRVKVRMPIKFRLQ